jgi:hypothetical protein
MVFLSWKEDAVEKVKERRRDIQSITSELRRVLL